MRPVAVVHGPGVTPERTASGAAIRIVLDASGVAGRLVRRLVDVPPGVVYSGVAGPAGELWFLISGTGRLAVGGQEAGGLAVGGQEAGGLEAGVSRFHGAWLPPGAGYRLRAGEPAGVQLDAVVLPADGPAASEQGAAGPGGAVRPLVRDLGACAVQATGDRRFRVLFGPGLGCAAATQFVGEIPPGRAAAHRHPYDEVVLVLAGQGIAHAGGADHRLAPGTCVHLPPGQQHCLENTGPATLVVLGVFHPGGSPAARSVPS